MAFQNPRRLYCEKGRERLGRRKVSGSNGEGQDGDDLLGERADQLSGIRRSADIERGANQLNFEGRSDAAAINQTAATEAARLRMVSSIVTGFFRDMDRRLEEMKPKY